MIGNNVNDVLLVRDTNGGNNNGAWGDGAWWIIILFLFVFCGWGNGGWGGYGNGGVQENYVLTSDFSQLSRQIADTTAMTERKLDGVTNGICSLGYDQLSQMNGINTNILTTGNMIQGAVKDCCCQTQQGIKDLNYNIATQANGINNTINTGFCQTNFNAQTNTRDIIDTQNAGTRAILDKLCQMEVNAKDEKIAEQAQKINALQLAASQAAQNDYLINQLRPAPVPAFNVPNPFAYNNCNCGGCC